MNIAPLLPFVYRLGPRAVARRSLAIALAESAAMIAPAGLVALLLAREGAFANRSVLAASLLLLVLAVLRVVGARSRVAARLARFELLLDHEELRVATGHRRDGESCERRIPVDHLTRAKVIPGELGGLRLFLRPGGGSETHAIRDRRREGSKFDRLSIDVPSGGDRYVELRSQLADLPRLSASLDVRRRSGRLASFRAARVGLLVASFFFVPFLVDDLLVHSRMAAYLAVLAVGLMLRWSVRSVG